MRSPTGYGIRVDASGDGHLFAKRGYRLHAGEDYYCREGQSIVAPFDLRITRIAYPKADKIMKGIAWEAGRTQGRLFYFIPTPKLIGQYVKEGQKIGVAQSVSAYYNDAEMNDHVHLQINN